MSRGQLIKVVLALFGIGVFFFFLGTFKRQLNTGGMPPSNFTDIDSSPANTASAAAPARTDEMLSQLSQFEKQIVAANDARVTAGDIGSDQPSAFAPPQKRNPAPTAKTPNTSGIMGLKPGDNSLEAQTMREIQAEVMKNLDAADLQAAEPRPDPFPPGRGIEAQGRSASPVSDDTSRLAAENRQLGAELALLRGESRRAAELEEKLAQAQNEIARLGGKPQGNKDSADQSSLLRRQLADAERGRDEALQQLAQLRKEFAEVKVSSNANKQSADEKGIREQALRQVMADLKTDAQAAKTELAQAKVDLERAKRQLKEAQSLAAQNGQGSLQLEKENQQLSNDLANAQEKIRELNEHIVGLSNETAAKAGVEAENAKLQTKLQKAAEEKTALEQELQSAGDLQSGLQDAEGRIAALTNEKTALQKAIADLRAKARSQIEESAGLQKNLDGKDGEIKARENEIQELKRQVSRALEENRVISNKFTLSEEMTKKIPELQSELIKLQNDLNEKNAEIALLNETQRKLIKNPNAPIPTRNPPPVQQQPQPPPTRIAVPVATTLPPAPPPQNPVAVPPADAMVVVVRANKVNLRAGPGMDHSAVMQVERGTRLTVETREGDWLRVFTPTGSRAYVQAEVVAEKGNPLVDIPLAPKPESLPGPAPKGDMVPFGNDVSRKPAPSAASSLDPAEQDALRAFESLKASIDRRK